MTVRLSGIVNDIKNEFFCLCFGAGDGTELYGLNTMAVMKVEIMNIINICRLSNTVDYLTLIESDRINEMIINPLHVNIADVPPSPLVRRSGLCQLTGRVLYSIIKMISFPMSSLYKTAPALSCLHPDISHNQIIILSPLLLLHPTIELITQVTLARPALIH